MYDTICAVKQSMLISSLLSAAIVGVVGDSAFCPDAWAEYAPENASREERFANPPASARMLPIWHEWKNDPAAWRRGLDNLESNGFGGFVGNANFGNGYVDSHAAMRRLGEFVRAGGAVIAFGTLPANSETEFPSSEVQALSQEIFNAKNQFPRERIDETAAMVSRIIEPPVAIAPGSDAAPIRTAHRRCRGNGDVFFVVNDAASPWRGRLRLCGGGTAIRWYPQTGEHADFTVDGEGWGEVAIPSYGAMLFTADSPANPRQVARGNAK